MEDAATVYDQRQRFENYEDWTRLASLGSLLYFFASVGDCVGILCHAYCTSSDRSIVAVPRDRFLALSKIMLFLQIVCRRRCLLD
jgi:hypothetical protein